MRDEATLKINDTLEAIIRAGTASEEDRSYAYHLIKDREETTAADAFGHAQITARLAQVEGLAARKLISEIEAHARKSIQLDPTFRRGAARRLLATLYVMAPARLLEHGDSEDGLEMLEELAERYPNDALTRLRLGEAYVSLDDPEGGEPHLCFARAHRAELSREQQQQLDRLIEGAALDSCPD